MIFYVTKKMNSFIFRRTLKQGRYEWRRHVVERLIERNISQEEVLKVLSKGVIIEDYSSDTPYPSALFFYKVFARPLHVVAAFDEENKWIYIITAYIPDRDHFMADYKTRRK